MSIITTRLLLVLQATEDTVAVLENAKQLLQQIGGRMTLVEIPKAGHAILPEQPEMIARVIIDYLIK